MRTCCDPGWTVALSLSANPKRKWPHTLEMVHNKKCWIGVNTHRSNQVVYEALQEGRIEGLSGYGLIKREVKYASNSRIDLLLTKEGLPPCFVEVKSVSFLGCEQDYLFPDAVSLRGQKHLENLIAEKKKGNRAVIFFLIQRSDGKGFAPAEQTDPVYAQLLKRALVEGVEIFTRFAQVSPQGLALGGEVPLSSAFDW